jgi:hypothetical protein
MQRILVFAFLAASPLASQAQEMLANSGFEGSYAGTATSWSTNIWNGAAATFTRETGNVRSGSSAQKFDITSLGTGGGAILLQAVTTVPGQSYRASLWVRGSIGTRVQLQLRQPGQNYRTIATDTITFTDTAWHRLEGRGGFVSDTSTQFVVNPLSSGTIWLDDASLQPETIATGPTDDPTTAATAAFFGIHYNKLGSYTVPAVTQPFGLVRLWDTGTKWRDIQPDSTSSFIWTRMDYVMGQVETANPGATVLMTLGTGPVWASARPTESATYGLGSAAEPSNIEYWRTYVKAVANRYKGRIDAYEIWNEVDYSGFWTGGTAKLLELAAVAYTEIKAIDPTAIILTPNFTAGSGPRVLSDYLDLGGAAYADVISCHVYFNTTPEFHLASLRGFLFTAASHAPGKPVWNTEGSVSSASALTDASLARGYVARTAMLQWAAGIRNFTWYCWDIHTLANQLALSTSNYSSPTDTGGAYFKTMQWLVGARVTTWETDANGVWMLTLALPSGHTGHILWQPSGSASFTIPNTWDVTRRRTLGGVIGIQSSPTVTVSPEPIMLDNLPVVPGEITTVSLTGLNDTTIDNNDTTPTTADGTDFGSAMIDNPDDTRTQIFTLTNYDNAALALTGTPRVQISGTNYSSFLLVGPDLPTFLPAGQSASFTLRFAPSVAGGHTATVTLPGTVTYAFTIAGTGNLPGPLAEIDTLPVDLPVVAGTTTVTAKMSLANKGASNLTWSASLPGRYGVVSSTDVGGPAVEWVDLASSGSGATKAAFPTANTANRDDQITPAIDIGFPFPFMGVNRSQVRISTNGFLTFNTAYSTSPLGASSLPTNAATLSANTVCALFNDLYLTGNIGQVYYKLTAPDTFVVSWESVAYFSDQYANMAFQVVLKRDGTITCNYNRHKTSSSNSLIGIQGANSNTDQAVTHANTTSVTVPLSVRFTPPPRALNGSTNLTPGAPTSWASLTASSGSLPAGETGFIQISLNPSNLVTGQTYRTTLTLSTNAGNAPTISVPFSLTVVPSQTFATWHLAWLGWPQDPDKSSSAMADTDGDGLTNLLEYALGATPTTADALIYQPACAITNEFLQLNFTRIADPTLVYSVEASDNLSDWTSVWSSTGAANAAGGVTATDPVTTSSKLRRFLKLRVTSP